jgi:opacity protein-like surface antigen
MARRAEREERRQSGLVISNSFQTPGFGRFLLSKTLVVLFVSIAAMAHAQDYSVAAHPNEFGVWGGGSPTSNVWIGKSPNRQFFLTGLRYGRVLLSGANMSLKYTVDVNPAAFLDQTDFHFLRTLSGGGLLFKRDHHYVYGAGASPIGLQLNFREHHRYQPYVNGSIGMLYFSRDVPVAQASHFNFAADWGGGVQIFLRPQRALSLGYRYHHFSNNLLGHFNPGVDSNLIYIGYSAFK